MNTKQYAYTIWCSCCTHFLEYFILLFVLLFKVSHLALKGTYSYTAQEIRLTSSQLLGTEPWLLSKLKLEISREKANKSRAIKMFPSELRKIPALWSVHTVFFLRASKHEAVPEFCIVRNTSFVFVFVFERTRQHALLKGYLQSPRSQVTSIIQMRTSKAKKPKKQNHTNKAFQTKKISQASLSPSISLPSKISNNSKQTCFS